jgi:hypothetical protein
VPIPDYPPEPVNKAALFLFLAEADFRFALVRLRENVEGIALYNAWQPMFFGSAERGSFCKPLLQPCPLFDPPEARDGFERRGSSVSACAHAVRHPLSVSPFSSRSGHCRPQHPHQEGSAPPCPGRGPLSRPQEKRRGRRRPSRQGQLSAVVSGGTRAPGDAALFGDHGIAEAELTAISPHAVQQHGELTGNRDHGFAPADPFDQRAPPAVQPARARRAAEQNVGRLRRADAEKSLAKPAAAWSGRLPSAFGQRCRPPCDHFLHVS